MGSRARVVIQLWRLKRFFLYKILNGVNKLFVTTAGENLTYGLASDEGIASVSGRTRAYGIVVYHFASSAYSASSRARVSTFLIATRLVLRAL
jgi:hypothetical protein